MNYINNIRKFIQENSGLSFLALNLFLLLIISYLYDPFNLFEKGYEGASSLISATQDNTHKVTFRSGKNEFSIVKKGKSEDAFLWILEYKNGASEAQYSADSERVEDFFKSVENARRYYSFSKTPENVQEMGFALNSSGQCECIQIDFLFENNHTETLLAGRSTAGGESHAVINDESRIYLVRSNLQSAAGYGELNFFRDRRIFSENVKSESITSINAKFKDAEKNVQLSMAGGIWRMVAPAPGSARIGTLPEDIAEMKAESFLEIPPQDMNTDDAFTLEVVYKKNLTEAASISMEILGSKENDIYFIKNKDGNIFQIHSSSMKDLYHPLERILEKESILEKTN